MPPKKMPTNRTTFQVITAGMTKLKYVLSKAPGATALPRMPATFWKPPEAPSR